MLSEKSDSVGVIHGFYLGALKLWYPLGISEFCRILSLMCSWAHCPLCFFDLSFTPLSEHVLRCNSSWMCPSPPVECVSPHLVPSLLQRDNCSVWANWLGGYYSKQQMGTQESRLLFLNPKINTQQGQEQRRKVGHISSLKVFMHNLTYSDLIIVVSINMKTTKCIYSV